jgi:hypothetical protein
VASCPIHGVNSSITELGGLSAGRFNGGLTGKDNQVRVGDVRIGGLDWLQDGESVGGSLIGGPVDLWREANASTIAATTAVGLTESTGTVPGKLRKVCYIDGIGINEVLDCSAYWTIVRKSGRSSRERILPILRDDRKSNFYKSYPTKGSVHGSALPRLGYFDDLRHYCGLGFNRSTAGYRALFAKEADTAILPWDDLTLRRLKNAKLGGDNDLTQKKQLHIVGYLFELCYDLGIPPETNVSLRPRLRPLAALILRKL